MYRHAVNQLDQIKILAELNNCSEEEIRDVLENHGIQPVGVRKTKFRTIPNKPWSVEELVQLLHLDATGMSDQRLAAHFNRTEHAIKSMKSKLNTKRTENTRAALEIFNRQRKVKSNGT